MKTQIKNCLKFTLILIVCFNFSVLNSQESNASFWDNVRFGGGLGLGFGNGFFSGSIAPSAIYQFNNQVATGIGLNATFANRENIYKSTILGASLLTLFNPINEIQLSAEFEELNVNRKWTDNAIKNQNYWYPALFLGAGYRTGNVTVGIRYDVLYDENKSIFVDPWMPFFRMYF